MSRIDWRNTLGWTDDQLDDLRNTAFSYIRQGKYDIAISFFEALTVLDPDSAYDAQTLGALYLQTNQPMKALKCFDKALKLEGDHTTTLMNLTKAFFMLGRREEALKLANILSNDPNTNISNIAKALILAFG